MSIVSDIERVAECIWEFPVSYKDGMRVPARIFATESLLSDMEDGVFNQITNVATLPGIVDYAMCMPDGHWGYGFPIGGVAAMDTGEGVISPGGIGFDINCGMRLVRTNLTYDEVKPRLKELVDTLFKRVPAGVGVSGFVDLSQDDFRDLIENGAKWCVANGCGWHEDLERTEENGCIQPADSDKVSLKAIKRGYKQVGTLGSGNHYLEIQVVKPDNILDKQRAEAFGITIPDQIVVMFHCGSRGFGHQVATDYLQNFVRIMHSKYGISVPDKQLACAPFQSQEGQNYFSAMNCAINMAFANRQVILHRIREVFSDMFNKSPEELDMHQIYDVTHNTAKVENHLIDGDERSLLIHRKGATRAFGPGMAGIPKIYKDIGQPVIIGGSMETGSFLLVGTEGSKKTFYSTAHGSGRTMSRKQAKKMFHGKELKQRMMEHDVYVHSASYAGLAEEAGAAYKNIDDVTFACEQADISKRVVRFIPVGNVKG